MATTTKTKSKRVGKKAGSRRLSRGWKRPIPTPSSTGFYQSPGTAHRFDPGSAGPGRSRQSNDCRSFQEIPNAPKITPTTPLPKLERQISKINFYRNKAKSIHNCCSEIVKRFNGKVPDKLDDLLYASRRRTKNSQYRARQRFRPTNHRRRHPRHAPLAATRIHKKHQPGQDRIRSHAACAGKAARAFLPSAAIPRPARLPCQKPALS